MTAAMPRRARTANRPVDEPCPACRARQLGKAQDPRATGAERSQQLDQLGIGAAQAVEGAHHDREEAGDRDDQGGRERDRDREHPDEGETTQGERPEERHEAGAESGAAHGMDWSSRKPGMRAEGRYHVETY